MSRRGLLIGGFEEVVERGCEHGCDFLGMESGNHGFFDERARLGFRWCRRRMEEGYAGAHGELVEEGRVGLGGNMECVREGTE